MESWINQRILKFFNAAHKVADITESPLLEDDPTKGAANGYTIGKTVAQRIFDTRNNLPARRFRSTEQLLAIQGFGTDKLHDLSTSLAIPADTFFRNRLFDGLLFDNWVVEAQRTVFDDEATFAAALQSAGNLKAVVANQQYEALTPYAPEVLRLQHLALQNAQLERWEDAEIASYNYAIWWYLFDYDNWFSFEQMQQACAGYLSYHSQREDRIELFLLRGFVDPAMLPMQRRNLLPIIVNHGERVITTWNVKLND